MMEITIAVNEMDILSVNKGQSAEITLDALPDRVFEGVVTDISSKGTNTGGATKYNVTVEVPRDPDMRSDMSCTVSILVSEADDVDVIPSAALITERSKNYVYTELSPEGTLGGRIEITTGISDGEYVEVKDGLSEGQTVYYRQKSVSLLEMSREAMGGSQSQVAS
jgi:multidrug efflux pump subunit AcrA (membrane-fusion protein)